MKICKNCGASNSNASKFCNECATSLVAVEPAEAVPDSTEFGRTGFVPPIARLILEDEKEDKSKAKVDNSSSAAALALSIANKAKELQKRRSADVMFVLDCTGSMKGEIDAIRDAIISFANTIESSGVRARVGLIEFRDRLVNEEHRALRFAGQPFTNDPKLFAREVSALRPYGGGDEPESSLDAVMFALKQPFLPETNKVIVLVTDAPPHIPDKETKSIEEVVQAIRDNNVQQFYLVIRTQDSRSQIYLKLLEGTRGMAFDLGKGNDFSSRSDHFKQTLMSLGKTISSATR